MTEIRSRPGGRVLPKITMTDSQWPAPDGWVKMQHGVNVRYIGTSAVGIGLFTR